MTFQLDFVGIKPGERLTHFIDRQVNPDSNYIAACGTCTKEVVNLMHSNLVPYSVAETIKGGSLGKGTAVKGMSDADLLFPLNNISSVPQLMKRVGQIKHEIHAALCGNGTGGRGIGSGDYAGGAACCSGGGGKVTASGSGGAGSGSVGGGKGTASGSGKAGDGSSGGGGGKGTASGSGGAGGGSVGGGKGTASGSGGAGGGSVGGGKGTASGSGETGGCSGGGGKGTARGSGGAGGGSVGGGKGTASGSGEAGSGSVGGGKGTASGSGGAGGGSGGSGKVNSKREAALLRKQEKQNRSYTVSDIKRTPFAVSFKMTQKDKSSSQNVDLLPIPKITENPSKFPKEQLANIYKEMKEHPDQRDYYGKCLSPLQVSFVRWQPEKVKRAIRLVKYWAKTNDHKIPSYAIELLTIKKYEDYHRPQPGGITEEKIVTSVFDELRNPRNIKIAWNTNYNPDEFGRPDGPYILDPANPYHNLFRKKTEEYWIRRNETERTVVSDPDLPKLESDASRTFQSLCQSQNGN